jgi:class 3 adenylate cyclase
MAALPAKAATPGLPIKTALPAMVPPINASAARGEIERLLVRAAESAARGHYEIAQTCLAEAGSRNADPSFAEVIEMMNLMLVKIEVREYELNEKAVALAEADHQLAATLEKVKMLEGIKNILYNFVSHSVQRILEENPQAPQEALAKREEDVTILFLDVAGYTSLSQHVASDQMNHLVEHYFSSFIDDIYQNGGDICEPLGDGLMLMFQHADPQQHARNAVRTALAVQEKLRLINLRQVTQTPVDLHLGAHSGKAQVGSTQFEGIAGARWTWSAYGMTVNLASRIGGKSKKGEVVLSGETARRVREHFFLESYGIHVFKNVDEPMELWRVIGARPS